ncbi:sodium:solute symporter family protein [Zobellia laminariae]|uniref:sodium:solute symporter family protein n=3 Tax=Zobellia laminariae TaxID=248906 RepID=UPI0026F46445|nr:sodium:solute symporter family protein [Zobellia laminariae]WKX76631.1 sodium:solute symporter family protein [Zobellia laminariae]
MSSFDYALLALYILGIFIISIVSSRRIKNQEDMFSAGGQAPWWASGLSAFMTMFSAGTFVVWGGIAYRYGLVAIIINMCFGVAALLGGYFVAGKWNALGIATPAAYLQLRFGKIGLNLYTWTMMLKEIMAVAIAVYSLAIILVALIPLDEGNILRDGLTGNLSLNYAILIFGAIVILYTMIGGLWAVLMTDVLQFIVLTLVVFMVSVLMVNGIDDYEVLLNNLPEGFFSPTASEYGWLFLFGWVSIAFFAVGAEWAFVQRYIAVKSPAEAKKTAYLFGGMYLFTPILWMLPPMLYRGINPSINPEQAYILASQSVLPVGILGLMFAAMFSATASMVSSQLNVFAGVLTNDFYKALLRPNASSGHLVKIGRIFTGTLGLALIGVALYVPNMGGAEKIIISMNSLVVVPLLAPALWGLFSPQIGIKDMLIVAFTSFSVGLILRFGFSISGGDVDVIIGVILPISMLFLIQKLKGNTTDIGWKKIEDNRTLKIMETPEVPDTTVDVFPQKVVMISLLVCALSLFALFFLTESGRTIIATFGICLLLIAMGIRVQIKKMTSKTTK